MTVTMTNGKMLESLRVLSEAEEKGVLGFAIAQNRRKLAAEVETYSAKYDELLKEYGKDEGGGRFRLSPEVVPVFEEALRPFAEMTVDVSVVQVSTEIFCGGDLTSSQMYALDWMVKED